MTTRRPWTFVGQGCKAVRNCPHVQLRRCVSVRSTAVGVITVPMQLQVFCLVQVVREAFLSPRRQKSRVHT